LLILQGPDAGKRYELNAPVIVVGRGTGNAVTLTDSRISRRHFELRLVPTGVQLHDLDSGNGTSVNGRAVRTADLMLGDKITIGDTILVLESSGSSTNHTALDLRPPMGDQTRIVVRSGDAASAVLRSVPADAGSQILTRPDIAGNEWLRSRLANLAVLYEATNAVSEILDVDVLLDRIVELVVRTTEADQGCALIYDAESGELLPKTVRSRTGRGPAEFVVSRTVVDHVFRERVGLLVADAAADERFRGGESISRHQIREVICVPMKGRHEMVGVLFLDTQAPSASGAALGQPIKFTEDHLKLAIAVGHQAALAIEETHYYQGMLQAERLAAVGQTIAALSHHIKNIMQGVRFGSDMVRMGFAEDDRELLTKGWRLVEKNQGKIDDLMLDMLSYSKDREPLIDPTDLASLTAEVLEVVRGRAADNGFAIDLRVIDTLPPIPCDADGVHHALLNVVSNAIDAVLDAPKKAITVEVRSSVDDRFAEVVVTDSGAGIAADKLADIFKPFVSTKGAKGTGLGLPVSRKTLREHGGDVIAENAPGGGARFTLRLPRITPIPPRSDLPPGPP